MTANKLAVNNFQVTQLILTTTKNSTVKFVFYKYKFTEGKSQSSLTSFPSNFMYGFNSIQTLKVRKNKIMGFFFNPKKKKYREKTRKPSILLKILFLFWIYSLSNILSNLQYWLLILSQSLTDT